MLFLHVPIHLFFIFVVSFWVQGDLGSPGTSSGQPQGRASSLGDPGVLAGEGVSEHRSFYLWKLVLSELAL